MALQIPIMFGMILVICIILYIINSSEEDNNFAKVFNYILTIAAFLLFIVTLNTASVLASESGLSSAVQTTLKTSYVVGVWIFLLAAVFMTINLIASIVSDKRRSDEDED